MFYICPILIFCCQKKSFIMVSAAKSLILTLKIWPVHILSPLLLVNQILLLLPHEVAHLCSLQIHCLSTSCFKLYVTKERNSIKSLKLFVILAKILIIWKRLVYNMMNGSKKENVENKFPHEVLKHVCNIHKECIITHKNNIACHCLSKLCVINRKLLV